MSGMIKVTDNFGEAAALLDKIARQAKNTVVLMAQCAGIMHDEVEENFEKEGRPQKWRGLKPSTIRARRKKGHWPGKILQVRGRLAASFQTDHDNNHAVCGTNVKYAAAQHFGTTTNFAARERVMRFGGIHAASMKGDHFGPGRPTRKFATYKKAQFSMRVQGKAYSVTIPARPVLYVGPGGIQRMIDAGKAWLTKH